MHHLVGMAEIAEMLGVSRQRVAQLIETYEDFPKPEVELTGGRVWSRTAIESWIASHPERGPGRQEPGEMRPRFFGRKSGGLFSRFTDLARNSVVKAQEEARLLQHNYIGTEHLLLGLIAVTDGVAFKTLDALGVSLPAVRKQIEDMIGRGTETPQGHIPFTPRAKKVLELSLRESRQLGHNYIGTEHVLLGLIRESEGVAWQALQVLGLQNAQARKAVLDTLSGHGIAALKAQADATVSCSFCGKTREQVRTIIAGSGVSICDECIQLSEAILEEESSGAPSDDLAERIRRLEERLARLEDTDDS